MAHRTNPIRAKTNAVNTAVRISRFIIR
jgi:hypothetical protein